MHKELIVSSTSLETRLAILEDDQVTALRIERSKNRGILGNIYKGRVTKVLPGMQAAFVDIGLDRHGFLYVGDFLADVQEESELFDVETATAGEALPHDRPSPKGRPTRKARPARQPAPTRKPRSTQEPGPTVETDDDLSRFPETRGSQARGGILPQRIQARGRPDDSRPPREGPPGLGILPDRLSGRDGNENSPARKALEEAEVDENSSGLFFFARETPRSGTTKGRKPARPRKTRRSGDGRDSNQAQINDLLKQGQEILVQVAKEPMGRKGVRLTSHIALPGRYLVFMPTVGRVGVSRQIESERERTRLKDVVVRNRGTSGRGFIVRTAGEGQPAEDVEADMNYLTRLWSNVVKRAEQTKAPALVHSEPGLVERIIRDRLTDDFKAIRVDSEDVYERVVEFVSAFNPDLVRKVRLHTKARPILDSFRVTPEIEHALESKVWLKSGAYIVINQTEALVAIDVNTGKFVGNTSSLEDTITQVNINAVQEIGRQLRLRGLGGIIIIDFIDMEESKNRRKVLDALHRELAKDKVPSRILRFNEFGLVAITRKRDRSSLEKTLCQPCYYCEGKGMTKSLRTIAYSIHGEVRKNRRHFGKSPELLVRCHPQVAETLREHEPEVIEEIEAMTGKVVAIQADPLLHVERFSIIES